MRALACVRSEPSDNGYARPLDGVVAVRRPQPQGGRAGRGLRRRAAAARGRQLGRRVRCPDRAADLKPLEIVQPEGPSFAVDGHEVRWQKWGFRVGFTPREGLVLHDVRYDDGGRERPVLYRASICEMVVPYGDPAETVLPQERLRHRRVRHRHAGQLAGAGLRLPGPDPLLRRPPLRQPRHGP